jgi:hypothetical protein
MLLERAKEKEYVVGGRLPTDARLLQVQVTLDAAPTCPQAQLGPTCCVAPCFSPRPAATDSNALGYYAPVLLQHEGLYVNFPPNVKYTDRFLGAQRGEVAVLAAGRVPGLRVGLPVRDQRPLSNSHHTAAR